MSDFAICPCVLEMHQLARWSEARESDMARLITTIQDAMNPHMRFVISDPIKQEVTAEKIKGILRRAEVVTWGWEVTDERIVFRVYKPHQYTAKGVLEEAGVKLD